MQEIINIHWKCLSIAVLQSQHSGQLLSSMNVVLITFALMHSRPLLISPFDIIFTIHRTPSNSIQIYRNHLGCCLLVLFFVTCCTTVTGFGFISWTVGRVFWFWKWSFTKSTTHLLSCIILQCSPQKNLVFLTYLKKLNKNKKETDWFHHKVEVFL